MTALLDHAVETLRNLPPDMQDEFARMVLGAVGEELPVIQLSQEDEGSFDESFAQEERGEFASDEDVSAIWAKYGL